jgi:hypothetical protein
MQVAKKRKKEPKWQDSYQRRFENSDFAWLAEQFQKQAQLNPDLTVAEFALSYGVQPKEIRRFIDAPLKTYKRITLSVGAAAKHFGVSSKVIRQWISTGALKAEMVRGDWMVYLSQQEKRIVNLWHGTTDGRAKAIMAEGFKVQGARRIGIWFTSSYKLASHVAISRAKQRNEVPVVISCEVDLGQYPALSRPAPHIYAFPSPVDKEIIRDVSVVKTRFKYSKGNKVKRKSMDIIVTRNAGKLGVWCWINRYLEIEGKAVVNEDHPAVEAIFKWIEAQYAAGRENPISDEEMLMQVMTHLQH